MKKVLLLLLIYLFVPVSYSQSKIVKKYHPFMDTWVFSGEIGLNLSYNDYENVGPGFSSRISADYFLPTYSRHGFGPRFFITSGFLRGTDSRRKIDEYRTKFITTGLGLVYSYQYDKNFYPYLSVGAGLMFFDPLDQDWNELPNNKAGLYKKVDINYIGEAGVKILIMNNLLFNVSLGVTTTATERLDDLNAGSQDDMFFNALVGLSYALGGKTDDDDDGIPDDIDHCPLTKAGLDVNERGCPLDTDEDGVADYLDKCPCTNPGAKVDVNGCVLDADKDGIADDIDKCLGTPEGIKVDVQGCPEDSDLDGVPDYLDLCEYTKLGVEVDINGCPLDADKDGVPDYEDKCPDTQIGVKVDDVGCPIIDKEYVLSGSLSFESGKTVLLPEAFKELDKLVAVIRDEPNSRWRIEGHTDSQGGSQENYQLSLARANAVLDYFLSKGLERARFDVIRFGEDYPVADNSTPEGRAKNRRVVIKRLY